MAPTASNGKGRKRTIKTRGSSPPEEKVSKGDGHTDEPDISFTAIDSKGEKTVFSVHSAKLRAVSEGGVLPEKSFMCSIPREPSEKPIELPVEVKAEGFQVFHDFLYGKRIKVTKRNWKSAFICQALVADCAEFEEKLVGSVKRILSPEICLKWIITCRKYNFYGTRLEHACWSYIDENTVDVLGSEKFLVVSHSLLKEILGRKTLKVREIFLYNNAYNWADAELKRQSRLVTGEAIRDVLGDALYLIRFPQMHPKEFTDGSDVDSVAEGPEADDVLTMNEKYEILRWYATGRPPQSSSFAYTARNAAGPLPSVPARSCHSCGYRSEDALVGPCPQCGQKTRLGVQCIGCGISFIVVGEGEWDAGSCRNGGADCSVLAYRCPCGAVNATEDDEHECFRCRKKAYVCRCGERDWPNASDEKCDACDEWA